MRNPVDNPYRHTYESSPPTMLRLLTAIKTSEWHTYEGISGVYYVTAGTVGPDAINLRVSLPVGNRTEERQEIEYQHVGADGWLPTGYDGRVSYDASREVTDDGDGYSFHPYQVTDIRLIIG